MDGRDRAFAMELVYGVLRRQETLDWRLEPALKKPLPRRSFTGGAPLPHRIVYGGLRGVA